MKKIIVTTSWDDGHVLDLRVVGLLKKYSIKGTFYISPKNREFSSRDLLSDHEIVSVSKAFEIGGHTLTHPVLTRINLAEARKEVVLGKDYLESLTNKKLYSFSYPRGKYNPELLDVVRDLGFKYARTVRRHSYDPPADILASPTSIHAQLQYQDMYDILKTSDWSLRKFVENINWAKLAKSSFDKLAPGQVFHFWGHSWIIDRNKDWDKLEDVLSYIGERKNVDYIENVGLADV